MRESGRRKVMERRVRGGERGVCVRSVYFFFFKQKTAYEIKECDWSSDVCSSDLYYRDIKASLDTKYEEGKIEGKIEIAVNLLKKGMSIEDIIDLTGLTKAQIEKLK